MQEFLVLEAEICRTTSCDGMKLKAMCSPAELSAQPQQALGAATQTVFGESWIYDL